MEPVVSSSSSPFKNDCLRGRVALITGGGSGIGFCVARQLGLHGAKVVIFGRRQNFLDEAVLTLEGDGIECFGVSGDVRNEEDAEDVLTKIIGKYGRLDTLVNGAAGNFLSNAAELSTNGFRTVINIDTIGTFNMSRAAYQYLKQSGQGVIINISATLQSPATFYQVHSAAAKAAIDSMTRSLALEWGPDNIRVVGIAPGPIEDTPGMAKLAPGVKEKHTASIPLRKWGSKTDIGLTAVYICSAAGQYVSGDTIIVDGAHWIYKPAFVPKEAVTKVSRGVEKKSRAVGIKSKL
mmetsp:Transcript_10835/g.14077  ORF Transcript_10835/g.14077 Transcript_10835/m.14077 type:complete len:293 (+) Transcript_10835:58-936(+)|eukprot:CAMPEP_0117758724 /NCGR_PEP_ID=MMETSP0947-20121206/15573_1 /TAXON_ID=44440 /ORGANISM="Chattonella subsalsa, Strain CCMP2191" /LENGTH=292 /DNA_ID=CAMNT_0005579015 /DNA_START=42 /DNA_END=920 /DNA_ORIENTATION=+